MNPIELFIRLIRKVILPKYPWIINVEFEVVDDDYDQHLGKTHFLIIFHYVSPDNRPLNIPGIRNLRLTVSEDLKSLWPVLGYTDTYTFFPRFYEVKINPRPYKDRFYGSY